MSNPLFSSIAISGARLLRDTYTTHSVTPKSLLEIVIFNLHIISNSYRTTHHLHSDDTILAKLQQESLNFILRDLSRYMSPNIAENFLNDRMQVYHKEYIKIAKNNDPVNTAALHHLFYIDPLGEYPDDYILTFKQNYFELVTFGCALMNVIIYLNQVTAPLKIK